MNINDYLKKQKQISDYSIDVFAEAFKGNVSILNHPEVTKYDHHFGCNPLFVLATHVNESKARILIGHHLANFVCNENGTTPLHVLARRQIKFNHRDMLLEDKLGNTPLSLINR